MTTCTCRRQCVNEWTIFQSTKRLKDMISNFNSCIILANILLLIYYFFFFLILMKYTFFHLNLMLLHWLLIFLMPFYCTLFLFAEIFISQMPVSEASLDDLTSLDHKADVIRCLNYNSMLIINQRLIQLVFPKHNSLKGLIIASSQS